MRLHRRRDCCVVRMGPPTQSAPKCDFYAHSEGANGRPEPLRDHLLAVARGAAEFATIFGAADEAYDTGLLHDFGKYGDLFQRRLKNLERGIDHWSAGAQVAMVPPYNVTPTAALAIEGHHIGLQQASIGHLQGLWTRARSNSTTRVSQPDDPGLLVLRSRFDADGLRVRPVPTSLAASNRYTAAMMLDVRMLFSALVDADFLATEEHFDGCSRPPSCGLQVHEWQASLRSTLDQKRQSRCVSESVMSMRVRLQDLCEQAAELAPGLFTLTAPTGSGKTLAMLRFALRHAERWSLRRIIIVAPYLSIIEQTADEWRSALGLQRHEHAILLEHHSMAIAPPCTDLTKREHERLAENWGAPIIITTSVQFLESLLSNRPAACRKLHRIAGSVVLFDEIQTLPHELVRPTLATLGRLSERYGASVLLATATQPAFQALSDQLERKRLFAGPWQPNEVNTAAADMFATAKRVQYEWPEEGEKMSWEELAQMLRSTREHQALCIVNLRRHAAELFDLVTIGSAVPTYHLSTLMCPQHRRNVLAAVRQVVAENAPCLLISTQCFEAGVDLDFPHVFRAVGPLEAIIQAAGRCNRNQRQALGNVRIFRPADNRFPSKTYEAAARLAERYARYDLDSPGTFAAYYRELYETLCLDQTDTELEKAIIYAYDFVETARLYRLIEPSVNVLVPWGDGKVLAHEVQQSFLTSDWIHRAYPFAVNVRHREVKQRPEFFDLVQTKSGSTAEDWYLLRDPKHYHEQKGLELPAERTGMWEV